MAISDFFYLNHQSQLEPLKITANRAYHKFLSIKQESKQTNLNYPIISKIPYGKYQRPYYFLDDGHQHWILIKQKDFHPIINLSKFPIVDSKFATPNFKRTLKRDKLQPLERTIIDTNLKDIL